VNAKSTSMLLALSILTVLAVPSGVLQAAVAQVLTEDDTIAQRIIDRTFQGIAQEPIQDTEQTQDQAQENNQSQNQSNTADVSHDESNSQANVLDTGDNTASTTQAGDNTAEDNKVQAESEGGNSGDAKDKKDSEASTSGGDSGDASASLNQTVDNEATTVQDSSADNNVLDNNNQFGDDVALIDQDTLAEEDTLNVGLQDETAEATQDSAQEADNFNFDVNVQVGLQREQPQPTPEPEPEPEPTPEPPPPTEQVFCFDFILASFGQIQACTETLTACEDLQALVGSDPNNSVLEGCHPVEQIV
jgi:hypothetical protein